MDDWGLMSTRWGLDGGRTSVLRVDGEVRVEDAEAGEGVVDEGCGCVVKVVWHCGCGFVLSRDEPAVASSVADRVGRRIDTSKATTLSIDAIRL